MVKANCRARFTAADFDFVVRILSKSPRDAVSLVRLLTDVDERDAILDHEAIADAILSQNNQLCISSAFYFYVLTRRVLRRAGIDDRVLCDYLAAVLDEFTRTTRLGSPAAAPGGTVYLSDLLLALREASPSQTFLLRAHLGNYTLFLTGIFPDNIERRHNRLGAPGCSFYEEMGRMSYRAVAGHEVARQWGLSQIFHGLSEQFHEIRMALNQLADRLLTLDDDAPPAPGPALLG